MVALKTDIGHLDDGTARAAPNCHQIATARATDVFLFANFAPQHAVGDATNQGAENGQTTQATTFAHFTPSTG